MKRNAFLGILGIEAVACVLLHIMQVSFSGVFLVTMAFPFEQIGLGLRTLSLSGGIDNAVAIAAYFMICLLPAASLLVFRKKRELHVEDALLGLLSVVLFVILYFMINPSIIGLPTGTAVGQSGGKAVLGIMAYSVICGYFVLRVLRLFSVGSIDKLERYMAIMLGLLSVIFVYFVFGVCFGGLLDSIATLWAGNAGSEDLLGVSYVFLMLQFIVDALPYALNVLIVFAALGLLDALRVDRYSAEAVAATERMSWLCTVVLAVMVLSNIGFNLLQLLFAKSLMVINSSLQIPVFSIIFVLATLLLTRFIAENRQLKDDNDMFI